MISLVLTNPIPAGRKTGYPEILYQQDPPDDEPRQLYEMPTSRPSDDERVSQDRRLSYSGSSATCVSTLIPRHHVAEDECFLQVQFRQPCNSTHSFAFEIIRD
jgi:hypothetical protein